MPLRSKYFCISFLKEKPAAQKIARLKSSYKTFLAAAEIKDDSFFRDEMLETVAWLWIAEEQHVLLIFSEEEVVEKLYGAMVWQHKESLPMQQVLLAFQQSLADGVQQQQPLSNQKKVVEKKEIAPLINENGIIVYNAGIVLLHPFIVSLFTTINLLDEEKQIKDPCRAISLLALLCSDGIETTEYKLPLLKLLCGIDDETFVFTPHKITTEEREESVALLTSVIEHWPALRSTSPAGLQETFLKRMGKLIFKNDHHELRVESHGTDVLLGSLPWGFSMIKLPWMKTYLTVEWN